ncbi:nuclear transport factor 2 family protein [Streptomyces sp. NPDC058326]|uniref:nuclear transport factor 2 family protein n=1 Tax=Streptomyces sp. NPDC058326 TaxID=3346447 RepID=UPI0036E4FA1B
MTDPSRSDADKSWEAQLGALLDRTQLSALIDTYASGLDAGRFDEAWARSLFTEDVDLHYPVGSHRGHTGLLSFTREIMERWQRTQHLTTGHLITPHGDRAQLEWNLLAVHIHPDDDPARAGLEPFRIGGRFEADAVRTPAGWRFARMSLRIIWTSGSPATGVPASAVVPPTPLDR